MKKYIIVLLIILLTGCSLESNGNNNSNNNNNNNHKKKQSEQVVTINLFHWSQCSHCQEEIAWLSELVTRRDDIKVNYYEVTAEEELYTKIKDELGVGDGVPLTVIGTDFILGFGDSTKAQIMNKIDKYSDNDYCDLVKLVATDKETEECYLKNN